MHCDTSLFLLTTPSRHLDTENTNCLSFESETLSYSCLIYDFKCSTDRGLSYSIFHFIMHTLGYKLRQKGGQSGTQTFLLRRHFLLWVGSSDRSTEQNNESQLSMQPKALLSEELGMRLNNQLPFLRIPYSTLNIKQQPPSKTLASISHAQAKKNCVLLICELKSAPGCKDKCCLSGLKPLCF